MSLPLSSPLRSLSPVNLLLQAFNEREKGGDREARRESLQLFQAFCYPFRLHNATLEYLTDGSRKLIKKCGSNFGEILGFELNKSLHVLALVNLHLLHFLPFYFLCINPPYVFPYFNPPYVFFHVASAASFNYRRMEALFCYSIGYFMLSCFLLASDTNVF